MRLALSSAAALVTAWLLSSCRIPGLSNVAGWNVGSVVFASLGWARIMTMNAVGTRRRAAAEDPGRTLVWVLVLGASAFSLFAALVVLRSARHLPAGQGGLLVGLCLFAVAMAWLLTHTSYALRYAHLYYRDDDEGIGGMEFPGQAEPCYFDFAYFSFTVGMCFQVSDVTIKSPLLRRTTLYHAVLSFVYNTVILAIALNFAIGTL